MSRRWLALVAAWSMLASPAAFAFHNEPTGFRGIEWGAPIDQVRAKKSTMFNRDLGLDLVEYRSRDELSMNGIPLTYNLYQFYKGRFSTGIMEAYATQCAPILELLIARFGQPDRKVSVRRFVWHGPITTIAYICNRHQDICRVGLESTVLFAERNHALVDTAQKGADF